MSIVLFLFDLTAHAFVPKISDNGSDLHWGVSEVSYQINFDGNHNLSRDEIEEAITNSSDTWKKNGSAENFHFFYEGESKERYANADDELFLVSFRDNWTQDPNVLAYAFTWHKEGGDSDGEIIHFDIEINSDHHTWNTDGNNDAYDLGNAITHEFGHALGLDHSEDPEASMAPTIPMGEIQKRDPSADDLEGFDHIYPADGIASNDDNSTDATENDNSNSGGSGVVGSDNENSYSGNNSAFVPVENGGCSSIPISNYLLFFIPLFLYRRQN
jgi:hypothetical protein